MLKFRRNKIELSKENEDKAAAATKESNSTRDTLRSQDNDNEKPEERDDEFRGLIEEKRCITKGDKQWLKEVSKRIKKYIRDKKKTRKDSADSARIQWHQEHQFCKKKERSFQRWKTKKATQSHQEEQLIATVFAEFCSKLYAEERFDEEEHNRRRSETRASKGGRNNAEEEKKEIPEITKMRCRLPSTASKKSKASDSNGI